MSLGGNLGYMKKKERIERLEGMVQRLAHRNGQMRRVLIRIAYYDLDHNDPLADCVLRQWAKEELDSQI